MVAEVSSPAGLSGSELAAREGAAFRVSARGVDALAAIELVGPDGVLARGDVAGRDGALAQYVAAPYVYARVVQADGEMAWSSPVFFGPKRA